MMEQKNENEFLLLKNYSNFLIDLGLNISFSDQNNNEIKLIKKKKMLKTVKDVDDHVKDWQNKNNYDLISRNNNNSSKNIIFLSEKNNFINLDHSQQNQPELLKKMFASIGQSLDDFFIINIDLLKMRENHKEKINTVLKFYFTILNPVTFIDMSSEDLDKFFEVFKYNSNFSYFKIPSISQIIKNQNLKRDAWLQLKLIKAKLNGL